MDVVFCSVTPDCLPQPPLHGPSRLSLAAGAMPPPFSVDGLRAPFPDEDVELAPLLCEEDFQQVMFDTEQQPGAPRPDGGGRGSNKRKLLPPPPSGEDGGGEEAEPAPRRRAKKRAGKKRQQQQLVLRAWHREIAARVLGRQSSCSPELNSRGETALRCQCLELEPAGRLCALHQDAPDRAWIHEMHGGVPLVGDPREVVVPSLSAGDGMVTVMQYARWRRSVFLATRFYVEHVAARKVEMMVD
ncbi:hypothetical protein BS78_07G158900 [Paspalum vaginatum]|nr:hypothetical protein BS78_07G158900 [Paspalum vaginatum]